jgi:ketosteroid isomerase-like protein
VSHNWYGIFIFLVSLCTSLVLRAADVTADIKAVLLTQQAAWNRGDIDGFMAGYVQSPDLRFASGGTITYGWQTTLERYKKHYPDQATMGTLAFSNLVVTVLAPDAALVFGRWELTRAGDKPWGLFSLTLKKTAAGWRIFQDHTSSATEK